MVGILIIATIMLFLLVDFAQLRLRGRRAWPWQQPVLERSAWRPLFAPDRFHCVNHTWFRINPDGTVRLGLDDFLMRAIGSPDRFELVGGHDVQKGQPFLRIHAGDRSLDILAAFDGRIRRINADVLAKPHLLFAEGQADWLLQVETDYLGDLAGTAPVADRATAWLRQEMERFRDFALAASSQPAAATSLPDGGEIEPGILNSLGEQDWRRFEEHFLGRAER
jgi:glycine cleavage system H lipoate-binding protein